jgi:hypothetical protein
MPKEEKCKIRKLIQTDPISEAEKMTGKSYKEDEFTLMLGMFESMRLAEEKKRCLKISNDTTFCMKTIDYMRNIEEFGFKMVYEESFEDKKRTETFYLYYHYEYGILLKMDTYLDDRNGADCYYNWIPYSKDYPYGTTHSGSWTKDRIHYGHCDVREAIRFKIKQLVNNGEFLVKWRKQPYLQLNHYMDWKEEYEKDHKYVDRKTEERIDKLPLDIQENIRGDMDAA